MKCSCIHCTMHSSYERNLSAFICRSDRNESRGLHKKDWRQNRKQILSWCLPVHGPRKPYKSGKWRMMTSSESSSGVVFGVGRILVTAVVAAVDNSCSNRWTNCAPGKATDLQVRWNSAFVTSCGCQNVARFHSSAVGREQQRWNMSEKHLLVMWCIRCAAFLLSKASVK